MNAPTGFVEPAGGFKKSPLIRIPGGDYSPPGSAQSRNPIAEAKAEEQAVGNTPTAAEPSQPLPVAPRIRQPDEGPVCGGRQSRVGQVVYFWMRDGAGTLSARAAILSRFDLHSRKWDLTVFEFGRVGGQRAIAFSEEPADVSWTWIEPINESAAADRIAALEAELASQRAHFEQQLIAVKEEVLGLLTAPKSEEPKNAE